MINVTTSKRHIAAGPLDAALRAALGAACTGLSHDGQTVRVHLDDAATLSEQAQAESIVVAHEPAILEATRQGGGIAVAVWLPYTNDITEVILLVEGVALPTATALSADQRGGLSGSADLTSEDAVTLGVQGYDHEEVTV